MPEKISNEKFTRIYLGLWSICILVALITFVLYKFGFRLTNQLQPVKVSSIELISTEADIKIFIDNREQRVALRDGRYVIKNIIPGLHSVLISKNNFWPWTKTVAVAPKDARTLYPFVFPMDGASAQKVTPGTADYSMAEKGFSKLELPESAPTSPEFFPDDSLIDWLEKNVPNYKLSPDKSIALYIKDNTIYVAWISATEPSPRYFCEENPCKLVMPVMVSIEPIKTVDFYKGLRNLILFSSGTTIYGIEVDREGTQNFQPFFKGTNPYFYQTDNGVLYIKDGNSILKVIL